MKTWSFFIGLLLTLVILQVPDSFARRTHLTPEQKSQLAQTQTVLVLKKVALSTPPWKRLWFNASRRLGILW